MRNIKLNNWQADLISLTVNFNRRVRPLSYFLHKRCSSVPSMVLDWWQSLCFSVEAINHDSLTAHCESQLLTLFFLILHLYPHIYPTRKLFFPAASLQSSKTFINNLQMDPASCSFFYLKVKSELSKFKYVNLSKLEICRCTIHLKCGMCLVLSLGGVIG